MENLILGLFNDKDLECTIKKYKKEGVYIVEAVVYYPDSEKPLSHLTLKIDFTGVSVSWELSGTHVPFVIYSEWVKRLEYMIEVGNL